VGDWNITVQGTGCHHNFARDDEWRDQNDADRAFERFVQELRSAGHRVHSATFTHGARQEAKDSE
jgi:hypothetical protein